jgi:hypothetical protein
MSSFSPRSSSRRPMSAQPSRRRPSLADPSQYMPEPMALTFENGISDHQNGHAGERRSSKQGTGSAHSFSSGSYTPRPRSAPPERPNPSERNRDHHNVSSHGFGEEEEALARILSMRQSKRKHSLPALSALKHKAEAILAREERRVAQAITKHLIDICMGPYGDWSACSEEDLTSLPRRLIDAGLHSELTKCMSDLLYVQRRIACGQLRDVLEDFKHADRALDALIADERIEDRSSDASAALSRRAFLRCACLHKNLVALLLLRQDENRYC